MLKKAIFGPGIETIENDGLLTSRDEVFGFGDSLTADPVLAFGGADHFAEFFFAAAIRGTFDTTLGHFGINHIAKVNFGQAHRGEIVNYYGFAAPSHANDGENVEV